jgi:hypothetical protein
VIGAAHFTVHKYNVYPHVHGDYSAVVWAAFKSPAQWPTSPFMLWFNSTGHGPIWVYITTYNKLGDEVMTYASQGCPRQATAPQCQMLSAGKTLCSRTKHRRSPTQRYSEITRIFSLLSIF